MVDDEIAGAVLIKTADDIQKCCLAAAGVTKNGDKFVLPEFQIDSLEGVHDGIADLVIFPDLTEFKHRVSLSRKELIDIAGFLL